MGYTRIEHTNSIVTDEFLNQDCISELGIIIEIFIYYLYSEKNHMAAYVYYYLGTGLIFHN